MSRMPPPKTPETPEQYARQRDREDSIRMKPMIWTIAAAAALMSGKGSTNATALADETLAAFDTRFIREVPELEGDDAG